MAAETLLGEGQTESADPGNETILGQTPDSSGQTPEQTPVDTTWRDGLPEDIRDNEALKGYESLDQLAAGMVDLKKTYAIPENADSYSWKMPDELKGTKKIDADLRNLAHEIKLTDSQFTKLQEFGMAEYNRNVDNRSDDEVLATLEKEEKEEFDDNKALLEKEWGKEYSNNIGRVQDIVKREFGPDGVKFMEDLGIGNNAKILLMLQRYADFHEEGKFHTSASHALTNESAQSRIDEILADPAFFKGDSPMAQKTQQKLVDEMTDLYQRYPRK